MKYQSLVPLSLLIATAAALAGCTGDSTSPSATGSVEVNLLVNNSEVTAVTFEVVCVSGTTLSGQTNVNDENDPPIATMFMDLPPGNCTITFNALNEQGEVICTGSEDFTVIADQTVNVDVVLLCPGEGDDPLGNVNVTATFEIVEGNLCPRLQFFEAVPDGRAAPITAEGSLVQTRSESPDGDPQTIVLSATGGSFDDTSSPNATYFCDNATGDQTLSVTVSDGDPDCDKTKTFVVACGSSSIRPLPAIYLTGNAINYSAFRDAGPDFGEIPSDEDILEDLTLLDLAGFDLLRLFGGDVVSEKILRIAAENFPNMKFQQGLFLEGVVGSCASDINDSQIETAVRLANTYDSVVSVSVGNETSFFAAFMPLECLEEYITRTRSQVTQPVTADDDWTFYAGIFNRKPDTVLRLLDFVAIHMYPITNYRQWDWKQESVPEGPARAEAMMNAAIAETRLNYDLVYAYVYTNAGGETVTVGETLPIVIGEAGWKWRQTNTSQEIETYAGNPVNAKWYSDLMRGWERSPGGPPTVFYFNSFDEEWKKTDDGWGLWDQFRAPLYGLCDTPAAGAPCNDPLYEGAGFFFLSPP